MLLAASGSAPPDELLLLLDLMVAVEGDDERVEPVDDLKRREHSALFGGLRFTQFWTSTCGIPN